MIIIAWYIYDSFDRWIGGAGGGSQSNRAAGIVFLIALAGALYITYSGGHHAVG